MFSPLTKVLIKIFVNGFYKAHSGLLFFLFVTFFIYFFFINVLNQTHLTPEERILYNLSLVLSFVSNPVIMGAIFTAWLIYTIKSWQYVTGQLQVAEQQFLYYSSTSRSKIHQFKSWFIVQLMILLPIIGYGIFALIISFIYNHFVAPVIVLLYIGLLTTVSAAYYVQFINRVVEVNPQSYLYKAVRYWRKPFFSLFLYHILDKMKLPYVLTKILSWLIISGILLFFSDVPLDLRVGSMIVLTVVTAHSFLIYQEHCFKDTYMSFSRNLPYSRARLFLDFTGASLILLLPECIWIVLHFTFNQTIILILFGLCTTLLFRSLLYWFGLNMRKYLRWIGGLFLLFQLVIAAGFVWFLVPVSLFISYLLFYRNYYQYKQII